MCAERSPRRRLGLHPARRHHQRQALDELAEDLPADAAVTDDDARAELVQLEALPDREIMDSVYRREAKALAERIANKK